MRNFLRARHAGQWRERESSNVAARRQSTRDVESSEQGRHRENSALAVKAIHPE
jgi:hypothetical protein